MSYEQGKETVFAEPVTYVGDQPTAFITKQGEVLSSTHRQLRVIPMSEVKKITGIGGAPARASTLPEDSKERKKYPVASGVLDYFPDAIVAISEVSYAGNEQHNPGKPLHWDRSKSDDEADTMQRHFLERGKLDKDGKRHTAKMAWRALALLQKEIEAENKA